MPYNIGGRGSDTLINWRLAMILRRSHFQWIRLRPPSCGPGFESHSQHLRLFQFVIEL